MADLIRDTFKRSKYRRPRPLEEIQADIEKLEREIMAMLREMSG